MMGVEVWMAMIVAAALEENYHEDYGGQEVWKLKSNRRVVGYGDCSDGYVFEIKNEILHLLTTEQRRLSAS